MIIKVNKLKMADSELVFYAASVLKVSEYRLFELAYHDWFGGTGKEAMLENAYMKYVVGGRTPIWVRNYARKTQQLCDEAGLYVPQMVTLSAAHPVLNRENLIITLGLVLVLLLSF